MIRIVAVALAAALMCGTTGAPGSLTGSAPSPGGLLPYNEAADANAEIRAATTQAATDKKYILLVFGANWCIDCRELSANMTKAPLSDLIDRRYVVVKVDVGNWNRNLDIVKAWGDPIAKGIPGLVVFDPHGAVLYATKAGEVANARWMGSEGLMRFFAALPQSK
jgi:protein disulfide-isomerase